MSNYYNEETLYIIKTIDTVSGGECLANPYNVVEITRTQGRVKSIICLSKEDILRAADMLHMHIG